MLWVGFYFLNDSPITFGISVPFLMLGGVGIILSYAQLIH